MILSPIFPLVFSLVVAAQSAPVEITPRMPQAYLLQLQAGSEQLVLVTDNGRYPIEAGAGCDVIAAGQNVQVLWGSGNVAVITPVEIGQACDISIDDPVSDVPCAVDVDGQCDIRSEVPMQ
jgi:hypothetical protein